MLKADPCMLNGYCRPAQSHPALNHALRIVRRLLMLSLFFAMICGKLYADMLIDDFERPDSPKPWIFSNGPEFPGATGSLNACPGWRGKGVRLAYDLASGGRYVRADLNLKVPVSASVIRFKVKSPPNIMIALRVMDSGNQTLQYMLSRPLYSTDANEWYEHSVDLASPTSWWGGVGDGVFRNPIRSIAILAANPLAPGAVGAVDFDDIVAVATTDLVLDPAGQSLVPAPPGSADLRSRLAVNIHFTRDDRALDAALAAGFSRVRMDLTWSAIEHQPGIYDWTAHDMLIHALQARGMKALLILGGGNALYTGPDALPPASPTSISAFAAFAEAAARHFKRTGTSFEIWNEPNISRFWPPKPDPDAYRLLMQQTLTSLRRGDPEVSVVTGGLSTFDHFFTERFLKGGGCTGATAFGVHPYLDVPEALTDHLVLLRSMLVQSSTTPLPVWCTEWGYASSQFGDGHNFSARQRQGVLVARQILSLLAVGFPWIVYYDIRDDGSDPSEIEHNYGLLANDYSEKPAMMAMRTLATVVHARRFTGFIPTPFSSACAMRFDGLHDLVVAVWCSAPNGKMRMAIPPLANAMDFLGGPVPTEVTALGPTLTVSEAKGPVYVTIAGTWQAENLVPTLSAKSSSTGAIQLSLDSPSGIPSGLEFSPDMKSWLTLTNWPNGGSVEFSQPIEALSSNGFYRGQLGP